MLSSRQTLGISGEEVAFQELKRRGYKILLRNYECMLGEIDLVAKDKGFLVFVEVKTRTSECMGHPAEALTADKRRQIVKVAQFYIKRYGIKDVPCRFDVVSILWPPNSEPQVDVIEGAFGENNC